MKDNLCATSDIIEKWYKTLRFPEKYDTEFYEALNNISISYDTNIVDYDMKCQCGKTNLLSFLYMCEKLSEQYKELKISEEILIDTLSDIVRWCEIWSNIKGELYLGELEWLSHHLKLELFKLGRLQFCMEKSSEEVHKLNIKKNENILGIHIPSGAPLNISECEKSISVAKTFYKTYFANERYEYFTCHSWLLDEKLKAILPHDSNIIKFGDLFVKVSKEPSDDIIHYVFGWNITREQAEKCNCKSSFARKVQECIRNGETFYCTRGFIKNTL